MGNTSSRAPSIVDHSVSWPKPESIPDPAYLVVGGALTEGVPRRSFYDNSAFYILDKNPPSTDASRYIQADFTDWNIKTGIMNKVWTTYLEKFNIIIFDYSVAKFAVDTTHGLRPVVGRLNKMLKPGGYLIIDTSFEFSLGEVTGEKPSSEELITKTKLPRESLEVKKIDDTSVDVQVKTLVEAVYGSHKQVKLLPTSYEYILQKKPMEGGQRRRCSRRYKRRRSIRKRRA